MCPYKFKKQWNLSPLEGWKIFYTHSCLFPNSLYKFPVNDQTILQGLISCNIQLLKKHSLAYLNFTRYIQVWTYEGRAKDLIIRRDWRHPIASVLRKKLRVTSFRARTPPWSDSTGQTKQEMKGSETVCWNAITETGERKTSYVLIRKHHYRIHAVYSWKFVVSKVGRQFWNNALTVHIRDTSTIVLDSVNHRS